jgi:hypothetical protein
MLPVFLSEPLIEAVWSDSDEWVIVFVCLHNISKTTQASLTV